MPPKSVNPLRRTLAKKDQPARGQPSCFRISRLIRHTGEGSGYITDTATTQKVFDIDDPGFEVNYGDFLLHCNSIASTEPLPVFEEELRMRNMAGQEKNVPSRMLQRINFPWGIPNAAKLVPRGTPLDLRFARSDIAGPLPIEDMTCVLVLRASPNDTSSGDDEDHDMVDLIDFEGSRSDFVAESDLEVVNHVPWNVYFEKDVMKILLEDILYHKPGDIPGGIPNYRYKGKWVLRDRWIAGRKREAELEDSS